MLITLKELALKVNGTLVGDGGVSISCVDDINLAQKGSITFAFSPKYKNSVESSKASAFVVTNQKDLIGKSGIVVENPYLSMITILNIFKSSKIASGKIHKDALVESSAIVGNATTIGPFSYVGKTSKVGKNVLIGSGVKINDDVEIGDNCIIHDNVVIYDNVKLGNSCEIDANTVIGSDGFGYHTEKNVHHKIPHIKNVIIGNNVHIGSSCTIDRGSVQNTIIGDDCKFDNQVHIAHNVNIGKACLLAGGVFVGGSTTIKDFAVIAGKSDIGPHLVLGPNTTLAARSCVLKSLQGDQVYAGNPARPLKEKLKRDAIIKRFELLEKKLKKDAI